MKLIKTSYGFQLEVAPDFWWNANDVHRLTIKRHSEVSSQYIPCEVGGDYPTYVETTDVCVNRIRHVALDDLSYFQIVRGGIRNEPTGTYTTAHCMFALFAYQPYDNCRGDLFIARKTGLGVHCFIVQHAGLLHTLRRQFAPKDFVYDICDSILRAYENGVEVGAHQTQKMFNDAFVEGRLKKRKSRNSDSCKVWIEPK